MNKDISLEAKEKGEVILNIGGGRIDPLVLPLLKSYFLVNLDIMYEAKARLRFEVEESHLIFVRSRPGVGTYEEKWFCNEDWKTFLSKYKLQFDRIVIYRFLEHVRMTEVPYFLYLVSTVLKKGGCIEVIVPNYEELARRILEEEPESPGFEGVNILNTTELLNEPEDPHASIWTPKRASYFFELEKRFRVTSLFEKFDFDGRDIYMWFMAKKVV